jgi:hypothetical protein
MDIIYEIRRRHLVQGSKALNLSRLTELLAQVLHGVGLAANSEEGALTV